MFLFSDVSCIYGYSHRGYPAKKDDATLNWVWTKSPIELFNYWKVPPTGIYLCQPLNQGYESRLPAGNINLPRFGGQETDLQEFQMDRLTKLNISQLCTPMHLLM